MIRKVEVGRKVRIFDLECCGVYLNQGETVIIEDVDTIDSFLVKNIENETAWCCRKCVEPQKKARRNGKK